MRSTSGGRPDEGASRAGGALNRRPAGPTGRRVGGQRRRSTSGWQADKGASRAGGALSRRPAGPTGRRVGGQCRRTSPVGPRGQQGRQDRLAMGLWRQLEELRHRPAGPMRASPSGRIPRVA